MKSYTFQIVIEKEPEDEGYFAHSPSLPGCFGNGKTAQAAKRSMRQAIEQHLQTMIAHGDPIPRRTKRVRIEELTVGVP